MEQLNNRETATLIWIGLFIAFILFFSFKNVSLKENLKQLLLSLFKTQICTPIILMFLYVFGIINILKLLHLWDYSQLKNTIFWFFTFSLSTLFQLNKIKENSYSFYKDTIKDSIRLITILQFIINFHSYSLVLELIIIPIISIITILSYAASKDERNLKVRKILDITLLIIYVIFLANFIYFTIIDYNSFFNTKNLQDFCTPIFLTVLFFPFIWILVLYSTYEEIFIRLPFFITNKKVILLAKLYLIFSFHCKRDHIEAWFDHIKIHKINSNKELIETISLIERRKRIENNPPIIPMESGWCPYAAKDFLSSYDLKPIRYTDIGDNIWFCSSCRELDDSPNSSTISYYIQGNEQFTTELKFKLFLHETNNIDILLNIYFNILDKLLKNSLHTILKKDIKEMIEKRESFEIFINSKIVDFKYEEFNHVLPAKCEFSITIKNPL